MGASEALREEMGSLGRSLGQDIKRRIVEASQSKLAEEQVAAAFEEGRTLTLDEALADAPGNHPALAPAHAGHHAQ
jgi:hypothetical protein